MRRKDREADGDPDHDEGEADRFLARRPIDVTELRSVPQLKNFFIPENIVIVSRLSQLKYRYTRGWR